MRAREPIGPIDSGLEAKELVAAGAFLERPAAVQGGGELANHGAEQGAGTEDQLGPTSRFRPEHLGNANKTASTAVAPQRCSLGTLSRK